MITLETFTEKKIAFPCGDGTVFSVEKEYKPKSLIVITEC